MTFFEHLVEFIHDLADLFGIGGILAVRVESAGRFQSFAESVPPGSQIRPAALGLCGLQHESSIETFVLMGLLQEEIDQSARGERGEIGAEISSGDRRVHGPVGGLVLPGGARQPSQAGGHAVFAEVPLVAQRTGAAVHQPARLGP